MQAELEVERPDLVIHLLAVNEIGHDSGIPDMAAEGALPILQDDTVALVWDNWDATWRDVFVLDGENETDTVYNLTDHDLSDPANYETLKALLIGLAEGL